MKLEKFIKNMPKAELHLHIEGTFEPELIFKIAKRNKIKLKYNTIKELKKAYNFKNLQDFLDIYYQAAGVLKTEQDFYDLTAAYLKKAVSQKVLHAEIFFDPQTHMERGISFKKIITGIHNACKKYERKISTKLIMCFLRHLDEKSAFKTLESGTVYKKWITAIGLDSSEISNPPSKFKNVFKKAEKLGFLSVAHAGEEGPAEYIWEAIDILKVSRIDHGNHSIDDKQLVKELLKRKIPLTMCPLSNLRLKVVKDLKKHPLKKMIGMGLAVTINSDDPAYFSGYINENYIVMQKALKLSKKEIYLIAKNSFEYSFLSQIEKNKLINRLERYYKRN